MSELRVAVGGLIALLIQKDNKKAAGVLLEPHQGNAPKHWPILLIPATATTNLPVIEYSELARRLSRLDGNVVGDLRNYKGIDVAGADIEIGGQSVQGELTQTATGVGRCPENDDWTDLGWLIDMNKAHNIGLFMRQRIADADTPIKNAAMMSWTFGELRGHVPVEKRTHTRVYAYRAYSGGTNIQAFTDAFEWRGDFETAAKLSVKKADGDAEIEFSGASSKAWLLYLPEMKTTASHFEHTSPLPYPGSHPSGSPKPVDKCDRIGLSDQRSGTGGETKEISVTITAKGPQADAMKVSLETETGGGTGSEGARAHAKERDLLANDDFDELGDSMCMGRKLTVDRV